MENKDKIQKANEFIARALVSTKKYDKSVEFEIKTKLLNCLRTVFAEEFKINECDINYTFYALKDSCAVFEINKIDDKDCYYIKIGEDYFKKSSLSGFIATISHEFGHLRQAEIEKRGGKVFDGVNVDEGKYALLDAWQKIGFEFKYNSSEDEYDANRFSMHKLRKWLDLAETLGEDKKVIRKKRKRTYKIDVEGGLNLDINKLLLKGWRAVNNLLNIQEEAAMLGEEMPDGVSDDEYLYNRNIKFFEEFGKQSEAELKKEIEEIEKRVQTRDGKRKRKTNSVKLSDEKLLLTDNYIKLLALELGLKQEELAISLGEHNELFRFEYLRDCNNKSPLYGYLSVSVRNMIELTTSEYLKILKQKINEIRNHKNTKDNNAEQFNS